MSSDAPGFGDGSLRGEIDRDVVIVEEFSVERMHGLVDGFLDREHDAPAQRVAVGAEALRRAGDEFEHVRRQRRRRLDVDAERADVAAQARGPPPRRSGRARTIR
jgi:hypothetical protein